MHSETRVGVLYNLGGMITFLAAEARGDDAHFTGWRTTAGLVGPSILAWNPEDVKPHADVLADPRDDGGISDLAVKCTAKTGVYLVALSRDSLDSTSLVIVILASI